MTCLLPFLAPIFLWSVSGLIFFLRLMPLNSPCSSLHNFLNPFQCLLGFSVLLAQEPLRLSLSPSPSSPSSPFTLTFTPSYPWDQRCLYRLIDHPNLPVRVLLSRLESILEALAIFLLDPPQPPHIPGPPYTCIHFLLNHVTIFLRARMGWCHSRWVLTMRL